MKQSTSPKLGYSDLIVTRVHRSPMIGIPKRQLVSKKDSEPVLRSVPSETTRRLPFPLPVPFSFFFSSFYQRSVAHWCSPTQPRFDVRPNAYRSWNLFLFVSLESTAIVRLYHSQVIPFLLL